MEQQAFESQIKKEGASLGIYLGGISAALGILMLYWLVSSSSFIVTSFGSISMYVVLLIITLLFCIRLRKSVGGYWTFKQALIGIFVMLFIAWAISSAVSLLFEQFVEPGIQERLLMNVQNNTIVFMENQGMADDQIDKATEQLDKAIEDAANMTWGQRLKSYAIMIIITFVVAMIFATIFKRSKPMFAPIEEE
ncbi:DUF4199 domain-containing protein [Parapedobacter sp. GCM10030251]|jgi:hypothetical protein|uniref:DUF4199 domain-containing protein n=1 Tax=Parapedobacter sp. GCM10030251 TaxID=3273419 RepID=UPI00361CFC38